MKRKPIELGLSVCVLIAWLLSSPAFSQSAPELIYDTREHIRDDANREGNKNLISEN